MSTPPEPGTASGRSRRWPGALAGLIAGLVAVGISQLVAGLTGPTGSPVAAAGSVAIDFTPPPVKNFAISAFGTHDKTVLISGVLVVLAALATAAGAAATRRLGYGLAGVGVLGAVGIAAALSRPTAGPADALPTLAGAAAAGWALTLMIRALPAAPAARGARAGQDAASSRPAGAGQRPEPDMWTRPQAGPQEDAPGAQWVPAGPQRPGAPGGAPWPPAGPPGGRRAAGPGQHRPAAADPGPARPDRRRFLVSSSVSFGVAAAGFLGARALPGPSVAAARSALRIPRPSVPAPPLPPGADLHIPGLSPFITPNGSFYRVDTALILPQVSPASWRLRIHGMVERDIEISFADLIRRPLIERYTTLTCVSEPVGGPYIGNAKWLGARLADLIREARPRAGADQLLCTSADGFTSGAPLGVVLDGREALLAVAMNGTPLPVPHGFPVRMVVPGLYGYVSATKWVTDIKVTTFAAEQAYWVPRGWAQQAPIKTESRIDVPGGAVRAGRTPVAGVAWAQHKGIDAVEVRVDRGPWHQARLAAVPGIDTWRQWVWEWDARPGTHLIEARATDATGYTQTASQHRAEPNGATGYPSVTVPVH